MINIGELYITAIVFLAGYWPYHVARFGKQTLLRSPGVTLIAGTINAGFSVGCYGLAFQTMLREQWWSGLVAGAIFILPFVHYPIDLVPQELTDEQSHTA